VVGTSGHGGGRAKSQVGVESDHPDECFEPLITRARDCHVFTVISRRLKIKVTKALDVNAPGTLGSVLGSPCMKKPGT